ncbi:MAG: 3-methylcatechol 2,3-dioxygenase [Burkholderia lata]|uniref:3-methylcatechol 2,3-dioxygenase n=1 Tax=Burkholderia lata (strain ATCC 17760 / DSM 23089 / LMG 22485 / NCIMB 9086 / R18194 / 383) TaxID=482957 RepID=A0A833PRG1_BURL3|nr:VOC family protein [Burkholderia lata]KAF1039843.1 MAG: 3-methylcatechol 2,3-dioxygenase [Burkholderia lata]
MSTVTELGYVGIEASDLAAWERFATDLLGMQVGSRADDMLSLRMDDAVHRWIVVRGPADDLAFTGFGCETDADLDAIVGRLRAAGNEVVEGDAQLCAQRSVRRLAVTADPLGNRIELYVGLAAADTPFQSPQRVSRFVTGGIGAGHQVLIENGADRSLLVDWYGLLGFRTTDVIDEEVAPGIVASVAFLHCNPRHHTVAFANMPFGKRMHHFMIEAADIGDVGLAHDRCLEAKQPLEMSLGMHPNDRMFSFYVRTPSGFNVEFGWGGLVIDESSWEVQHLDRLSTWGHRPPHVVADLLRG